MINTEFRINSLTIALPSALIINDNWIDYQKSIGLPCSYIHWLFTVYHYQIVTMYLFTSQMMYVLNCGSKYVVNRLVMYVTAIS